MMTTKRIPKALQRFCTPAFFFQDQILKTHPVPEREFILEFNYTQRRQQMEECRYTGNRTTITRSYSSRLGTALFSTQSNGPFLIFTEEKLSYKSFVNFWPVQFPSRTLGASHTNSDGESRLAEETKQTPSPYHLTYTADPLASLATFFFFTGRILQSGSYQY
jgi:hypothetical protein